MNAVSISDTLGFATAMVIPQFDPTVESANWVDSPDGNLATTAFGEISATDTENRVFIIKRDGEGRNWKKVRVLQDGEGYTLQYADIAATEFQVLSIGKNPDYNFAHVDLDNGEVNVPPEKEKWDLMYGT